MDFPSSPHIPVRIRLRGGAAKEYVQVLKRPASFDTTKPAGCARKPLPVPDQTLCKLTAMENRSNRSLSQSERQNLDDVLGSILDSAEAQWCGIFDKVDGSGNCDTKYCGRSRGVQVVKQLALLPMANEYGNADDVASQSTP